MELSPNFTLSGKSRCTASPLFRLGSIPTPTDRRRRGDLLSPDRGQDARSVADFDACFFCSGVVAAVGSPLPHLLLLLPPPGLRQIATVSSLELIAAPHQGHAASVLRAWPNVVPQTFHMIRRGEASWRQNASIPRSAGEVPVPLTPGGASTRTTVA